MTRLQDGTSPTVTTVSGRPEATDTPGYLVLLDRSGREAGRAIHNAAGPVAVLAPQNGQYRLQSERVGYHSVTSELLDLRAGQIIDMTIGAAREPIQLSQRTFSPGSCGEHVDRDPVLGILWGEIRKAIAAVTWAGGHILYEYVGTTFDRTVDVDGRVNSEETMAVSGPVMLGSNLLSGEHDDYVGTHSAAAGSFLATGGDYLLSDAFQEDYCFAITEGRADMVGLTFTPISARRDVADVTGTFWLDRATAELRLLEYRAVNLPYDPDQRTGGMIRLLRVPSGRWVVSEWKTRTPVVRRDGGREMLVEFRDRGGVIARIATAGGEPLHSAPVAELRGSVVNENAAAVKGATVALLGTPYAAVTDSMGNFTLSGYFEGDYAVSLHDAELPSADVGVPEQLVALAPGRIDTVRLTMPGSGSILSSVCMDGSSNPSQRVIRGVVYDDQSDEVLQGVRIVTVTGSDEISTLTDSTGFYAICGLVPDAPIELFAEYNGNVSGGVTLTFVDGGVNREVRDGENVLSEYRPTASVAWTENLRIEQVPITYPSPPATIGFKFGLASTTVSGDGVTAQAVRGLQGGMFYENYGKYLGWRVEGGYVRQGAYSPADGQRMTLHYIRIPVLAALRTSYDASRTFTPFFLGGPAFGFDTKGNRGVPKGDVSLMFGGGVRVRMGTVSVAAEATYGLGITSNVPPFLNEPPEFATFVPRFFRGAEFKNRVLSVAISLAFSLRPGAIGMAGPGVRSGRPPTRDIITRAQIVATDVTTAYELIQRLHPQWLRARGQVTMRGVGAEETDALETGPVVYFDNSRMGDIEELRNIAIQSIDEIFYFNGRDASFRFGAGHGAGVIQVITQ